MSLLQCIIWHCTGQKKREKKGEKIAQSSFVFFFNFMCQMHSADANVAMTDNFTSMDNMAPEKVILSSFNFMCQTHSTDANASKIMSLVCLKHIVHSFSELLMKYYSLQINVYNNDDQQVRTFFLALKMYLIKMGQSTVTDCPQVCSILL